MFICLFVCLLFCFFVTYVFSAASLAEEKSLAFQMNTNHNPLQNVGDVCCLELSLTFIFLCVRSPRRILVFMRLFWRMTEDRTLPHWIWQIKVTLRSLTLIKSVSKCSKYITWTDQIFFFFKVSKIWWMKFSVLSVRRNFLCLSDSF